MVGCSVDTAFRKVCSSLLDEVHKLSCGMFRAIEHHVFDEMRKPRAAIRLMLRPRVIPTVHVYHWEPAVDMKNYLETIRQSVAVNGRSRDVVRLDWLDVFDGRVRWT